MTKMIGKIPFWIRTLIIPFILLAIIAFAQHFISASLIYLLLSAGIIIRDILYLVTQALIYFVTAFIICYFWKAPAKRNYYWKTALNLVLLQFPVILAVNIVNGNLYSALFLALPFNILERRGITLLCDIISQIIIPIIFCLMIKRAGWFGGEAPEWLPLTKKNSKPAKIFVTIILIAGLAAGFIGNKLAETYMGIYAYGNFYASLFGASGKIINPYRLMTYLFTPLTSVSIYRLFLSAPAANNKNTAKTPAENENLTEI